MTLREYAYKFADDDHVHYAYGDNLADALATEAQYRIPRDGEPRLIVVEGKKRYWLRAKIKVETQVYPASTVEAPSKRHG